MNRHALSLTQGILLTALALVALFIVGAVLSSKGNIGETGETEETGDETNSGPEAGAPGETCGQRNAVCETSDDCCGKMGLECQEVRTSDGGFGKRCLPVEVMVCKSDCESDLWSAPRACKKAVPPKDMARCPDFVGTECKTSVHEARNTRECTDT